MKENALIPCAPVTTTLGVIGGKWKLLILFHLSQRTYRFGQLMKLMPGITQKMLTQQLRQLEENHLIKRKVYPVVPPKVEYSMTDYGRTLHPIIKSMYAWGQNHRARKTQMV